MTTENDRCVLESNISILGLSPLKMAALEEKGISTIGQLIALTKSELLRVRHIGRGTIKQIEETLAEHGLKIAGSLTLEGKLNEIDYKIRQLEKQLERLREQRADWAEIVEINSSKKRIV